MAGCARLQEMTVLLSCNGYRQWRWWWQHGAVPSGVGHRLPVGTCVQQRVVASGVVPAVIDVARNQCFMGTSGPDRAWRVPWQLSGVVSSDVPGRPTDRAVTTSTLEGQRDGRQ